MSDAPRAIYADPNTNTSVLAAIYALALQKYKEQQMAVEPAPELNGRDGTTVQGDSADGRTIP